MKRIRSIAAVALISLMAVGCVSKGEYLKKAEQADKLDQELALLQKKHSALGKEHEALKAEAQKLRDDLDLAGKERDKLVLEKNELDSLIKAKSDELSKNVVDLRQRINALEAENARLRGEVAVLQKAKEEKLKEVSSTYEQLLDRMKNEIAQGQVTISELKGKLTVNLVEAILFDSGKAEVKQQGLPVLQKVVDILKPVKDKAIRIEGHTDNVQIIGALAKKYPTNWELSAARAINVARYLQQQGLDPSSLSAAAYGEFKPVAENSTDEGRAKNRRIEIVLVPKD